MPARISVVVPVYNVEQYLPRCLRSLEAQTVFSDMEILLIDDGSPDGSGAICDQFAEKYPNVRVIHQQNGGVSSARNAALAVASGDYIGFVDSDDFVREDAFDLALRAATARDADMVVFRFAHVDGDDEVFKPPLPGEAREIRGAKAVLSALVDHRFGIIEGLCDKLFRREVLMDLRSPTDLRCGEDAVLLAEALTRVDRAVVLNDYLYFYRQRPGSAMHTFSGSVPDERIAAHFRIAEIARAHFPEIYPSALARALHMRLFVLNDLMDVPDFRLLPCWGRQIAALRKSLPRLFAVRSGRWMPPQRKAYAALLAFFPGLAVRLHKRRLRKRKDHASCPQTSA